MSFLTSYVSVWFITVVLGGVFFVLSLLYAPEFWWRVLSYRRWVLGAAALGLAGYVLVVIANRYPAENYAPGTLPPILRAGYWFWVVLFGLAGTATLVAVAEEFVARRFPPAPPDASEDRDDSTPGVSRRAEVVTAWDEIQVKLSAAGIVLARQDVFLLLAPSEAEAEALIDSAGARIFTRGPEHDAPIHAYATPDGLFLSVAGISVFGTHQANAVDDLAYVLEQLRSAAPDCPPVRGIAVLFPFEWAQQPDAVRQANTIRADLQAIERGLGLRLPVFAVFVGMERVTGFTDFVRRLGAQTSAAAVDRRVGFGVPSTHPFGGELVQSGLTWISDWFAAWSLHLIQGDLADSHGNGRIVELNEKLRHARPRLRAVLEAAFSTPREREPVLFRGCYVASTGRGPGEQAFVGGLVRSAKSRIIADGIAAGWCDEAYDEDASYRRAAWTVGLVTGALALAVWVGIVVRYGGWWMLGPLVLALAWLLAFVRRKRARNAE